MRSVFRAMWVMQFVAGIVLFVFTNTADASRRKWRTRKCCSAQSKVQCCKTAQRCTCIVQPFYNAGSYVLHYARRHEDDTNCGQFTTVIYSASSVLAPETCPSCSPKFCPSIADGCGC